jgi:ribose/xylose/arabinose/galactoside ABC-type transport system permease subunit
MRNKVGNKSIAISILSSIFKMIRKNPVSWLIIGLTILFATLYSESFLTGTNLESILKGFVITSMLSIGPTFVVLMGSLDVSYMGIWMFGGALVWLLFPYLGIASIFIYPIFGLALGFINGIVHVKSKIPSFILTLSMTAVLAYLTTVIRNIYGVLTLAVPEYRFLTGSLIQYVPTTFLLALPVFILSFFFMNFTKLGTYLCAIGSNEEGAELAGINVKKYKVLGFAVSGFLSGLGSIALYSYLGARAPVTLDLNEMIRGLAAIVLGGTPLVGGIGGPHRTLFGALAYVLIFNGLFLAGIDPNQFKLYIGLTLIAAVLIASRGLKGVLIA